MKPEREGREGDSQPMPVPNDLQDIQSYVIEDIEKRRELGIQRYGTPLQPHNGRDALKDAYEEALDLAMYLKQAIVERDNQEMKVCTMCGEAITYSDEYVELTTLRDLPRSVFMHVRSCT